MTEALGRYSVPDIFNTDQADRPGSEQARERPSPGGAALRPRQVPFCSRRCCYVQDVAQFTAQAFTSVLEQHGVQISMDGKGRWIGNVFTERFWRSLTYEEVYLVAYNDLSETKVGLERYLVQPQASSYQPG